MTDVDRFLSRVVPWGRPGFVGIHYSPHYGGRAFQEFRSAVGFTNGMMRNPTDLFVCMSLQSKAHDPEIKNGRQRRRAIRLAENAVALKSFWIDVDIKKGEYRDANHALVEYDAWRQKVGLPKASFIVLTGSGGFHAHWLLDEPITHDRWQPLAHALVEAANREGLKIDAGRSINAAQIMRIPGTFNQKHQPPRLAQIIAERPDCPLALIEQALSPYKTSYAPGVTQPVVGKLGKPSAVFAGVALPGRLDAGIDTYVPTIEEVAEECPFIDATLQTGGAGYSEPLWRESLRVACFVQEGEEVAHELSDGHVGYTEIETDNKFAYIVQNHRQYGWPQCQKIHDEGAQECRQCPHLPKGRSPLNFALPKAIAAVAAAASIAISPVPTPAMSMATSMAKYLPDDYGQHRNLVVYKVVKNEKDPSMPDMQVDILPLPMFDINAYEKTSDAGSYRLGFKVAIKPDMIRTIDLTYDDINDPRKLGDRLGRQGLLVTTVQSKMLKEFLVSFVQKLKEAKARVIYDTAPDGFLRKDGPKPAGFVYNRMMWNGSTPIPISPLSPKLASFYQPTGDLSVWKGVVQLILNQKRPELIVPLCASAGTPLIPLTGHAGAVIHMYGESGGGKSNGLVLAQTLWGNPSRISKMNDTVIGIDVKLGQLHNLPFIFDDIFKSKNRNLIDLFMRIGEGETRQRAERSGQELADTHHWALMMLSASNPNMHSYIAEHDTATIAAVNRVFQYYVGQNKTGVGVISGAEADRAFGSLAHHYGQGGLELAKFYGANYDTCDQLIAELMKGVDRRGQCGDDDRFHRASISVTLAGGMLLNKLLNLNIDMDQIEGFLIERLQEQRQQRTIAPNDMGNPANIERLIGEFIHANADRMLTTKYVWLAAGRAPNNFNAEIVHVPTFKGDQRVVARNALADKRIRVSLPDFATWLRKERDVSLGDMRVAMNKMPNLRVGKFDLGHGAANYKQVRIMCLEITDPSFWDYN